jgi:hypothetical protein
VSSGCIRLTNDDIVDLYGRVQVGTRSWCFDAASWRRPGDQQSTPGRAGARAGEAGRAAEAPPPRAQAPRYRNPRAPAAAAKADTSSKRHDGARRARRSRRPLRSPRPPTSWRNKAGARLGRRAVVAADRSVAGMLPRRCSTQVPINRMAL